MAKDDTEEVTLITLDTDEFNRVVQRVQDFLLSRAQKAKEKKKAHPTKKSVSNHIETAKDVYVFTHMVELIEHMSEEIADLRDILAVTEKMDEAYDSGMPKLFTNKKEYLN